MSKDIEVTPVIKEEKLKMLGQKIPEGLYWQFKAKAAQRHENMQEAVENAVSLYVDFKIEEEK